MPAKHGTAGDTDAQRRERLARRVEEIAQLGGWEWNLETSELFWSDNLYRLVGYEPNEIEPTVEFLLDRTHDDDRDAVLAVVESIRRTGRRVAPVEYRFRRADGAVRHFRSTLVTAERKGRKVRLIVGTVQDVTDQLQAEREIRAHTAVADALSNWESLEAGATMLLEQLAGALGFAVGVLWVPDDEALHARAFWSVGSLETEELRRVTLAAALGPSVGLPGQAWTAGRPLEVADISETPSPRVLEAVSVGLVGAVAIPAVRPPEVLAVVALYARDRSSMSERLMRSLTAIGYELGEFLSHRRGDLGHVRITPREREILQLAAEGLTARQIAVRLGIGPATVRTHLGHLYERWDVPDRAAAVAQGIREGLIE